MNINVIEEDKYIVVTWPDTQDIAEWEGFSENAYLINDQQGIDDFGGCAYFVEVNWLTAEMQKRNLI